MRVPEQRSLITDLVFYVCIARGTVILAEFNKETNLNDLALRCIEKAPPYHSIYSHTVRKRTYTFLIQDPFVYFGIFHEDMYKSEVFAFLNRLRLVFEEFMEKKSLKDFNNFTSYCFQSQFDSTFQKILGSNLNKTMSSKLMRAVSLNSIKTKQVSLIPKFSNVNGVIMKKKKKVVRDDNGEGGKYAKSLNDSADSYEDNNGFGSRDFTLLMQKNGSNVERQKAKQIWQKHVWIVLSIDLFVCLVLFAVWLCVCRGFQCIET